jgi:hypothetical protein
MGEASPSREPAFWAVGLVLVGLSGCSKSFTAREYPSFYDPNLRTVAVIPFRNETKARGAGVLAAESLAAALGANGTYTVITPRRLESLLARKKLPRTLSPSDYAKDAETLRKLGGVQAFVAGRVLRDSMIASPYPVFGYHPAEDVPTGRVRAELVQEDEDQEEQNEEEFGDEFPEDFGYGLGPPYPPDLYWGYPYPFYYPYYYPYYYQPPEYSARAHVSLEAVLVQVSDAAVLYATPVPVQGQADLTSNNRILGTSATLDAMHQAASKLVKDLAVVPVKVKLNPRDNLRTAAAEEDGQWVFRNTFHSSDERMYVVMSLPATVGHDSFRLTVTPKGRPNEAIVTKDFTWPVGRATDAVTISPRQIAQRAGPGEYTVSFLAMGETVMRHQFAIR